MNTLDAIAGQWLTRLAWTSLQATLLMGLIALLMRLRPGLAATIRCALWWLVSLQALVGLAAPAPLALPWLAAPKAQIVAQAPGDLAASAAVEYTSPAAVEKAQAPVTAKVPIWRISLLALWLAGVLMPLPLWLRDARRVRQRRSETSHAGEALCRLCLELCATMQLRRPPAIRITPSIRSPQIVGLRQPTILWPADASLDKAETAMAMAHELAHVKRGDLWLGWVPAIARRLFFFHPLVAIAVREYALQREAACDAQVLQQHSVDPHAYGQLLLRLGVTRPLPAGLAGASPTFGNLKRRLIMLKQSKPAPRLRTWLLIAVIAAIGVMPYRVTAAAGDVATTDHRSNPTLSPPPPPAPPVPPAPPPPPAPPALPAGLAMLHHVNIDTAHDSDRGFALIDGDSATIRGASEDTAAVARLHKRNGDALLWVRNGRHGYVIRDPSVLAMAKSIQAPFTQLTREQGRLAGRVGEIAGEEAGIAAREGGFASEQAELAGRQAALESQVAMGNSPASPAELARQRQTLNAQRKQIDTRHAALERDLASQRDALSKQRRTLAAQIKALDERSRQADAHSRKAMDKLVADAIKDGTAQPVPLH